MLSSQEINVKGCMFERGKRQRDRKMRNKKISGVFASCVKKTIKINLYEWTSN